MAPAPAPLRRDARRNRELVLAAAEDVFARRGLGATLEEVADAAGVGVGTIYRRFPNKDALVAAVFERRILASVDTVGECLRMPTAWAGLCTLMRRGLEEQAADRGLHEIMHTGELMSGQLSEIRRLVEPMMSELVAGAKAEGALRDDFAVNDIPMITLMLSRLAHTHPTLGPDLARRYLELLLKGLAPVADGAPVPLPPDDQAYSAWVSSLSRDS